MHNDIAMTLVQPADAAALIASNRANMAYHAPWVAPPVTSDQFDRWMARIAAGRHIALIGRLPDTQAIIGVVNISEIVMQPFCSAYLGYYGMADHAGRGLMTHLLRRAIEYAFNVKNLHRLEANIQPDNLRSRALVQRLGFTREGYSRRYLHIAGSWRDHERWAILADDPAA
jgi:ribosomal-protein-alanine N-acetyltransferase